MEMLELYDDYMTHDMKQARIRDLIHTIIHQDPET